MRNSCTDVYRVCSLSGERDPAQSLASGSEAPAISTLLSNATAMSICIGDWPYRSFLFSLFFFFFIEWHRMSPFFLYFFLHRFSRCNTIYLLTGMSRIESWLYFSCFFLFIVIDLRDRNADAILDSRTRSSKNILRVLNFVFLKMKDEHLNKRRSSFEIIRFE